MLVGTNKGAFILTSDGKRDKWDVSGPHFAGLGDLPHERIASDPDRIYVSQTSGWFGQIIQRSTTAAKPGRRRAARPRLGPFGPRRTSNKFVYDTSPETGKPLTTHQLYDGKQHPWEFKRVWHLEPSLTDPDTAYAGIEDAAIFRTTDGATTWHEMPGLRGHGTGPKWQPGAGGMCLHTHPSRSQRSRSGCTSRSRPRARFAATMAARRGSRSTRDCVRNYMPDPTAEVGHCVHHVAMSPKKPGTLFMQKHWDVMRSDDAGDNWKEVSGNLPTDFGFVIDVHAHEPETIYVVPIKSDGAALSAGRQAAGVPQPHRRQRVGGADQRPAAEQLLRERAARRHVRRFAGSIAASTSAPPAARCMFTRRRRQLDADRARSSGGAVGRSADDRVGRL